VSVTIAVISVSAPVPAVVGIVINFGKGFLPFRSLGTLSKNQNPTEVFRY